MMRADGSDDGKDHPSAEPGIGSAAILALQDYPGGIEGFKGHPLFLREGEQPRGILRGVSETEGPYGGGSEFPSFQVFQARFSRLFLEHTVKILRGGDIGGDDQFRLFTGSGSGIPALRHLKAHSSSQVLHGFHEAHAGDFHEEIDDIAALAAAETVIELPLAIDIERRRLLVVEGAAPHGCGTAPFQVHILPDDLGDVDPALHFLFEYREIVNHGKNSRKKRLIHNCGKTMTN